MNADMDMELDTLATKQHWVHGSMNRPFTLIVALYLAEQTSLDIAVKEIVSVINEIYYGGESAFDLEESLKDIWASILHASKKIPRDSPSHPPNVPTAPQLLLLNLLTSLQSQPDPASVPQTNPFADPNVSLLDLDVDDPLLPRDTGAATTTTTTTTNPSADTTDDNTLNLDWGSETVPPTAPREIHPVRRRTSSNIRKEMSWAYLPLFEEVVLQALGDEPGRRAGFSATEIVGWERFVAFLAHVTKREVVRLEGVAIAMMRWALEEGHDSLPTTTTTTSSSGSQEGSGVEKKEQRHHSWGRHGRAKSHSSGPSYEEHVARTRVEAKRLNVYVAAAALWAIIMGEELWQRRGEDEESPIGLSLTPAPEPHIGRISKRRWRMWIDRLQFLSQREDLTISTRELAAEAAAVMLRVV
ncbi:hypothetical protein FE257_009825 [Aspergillus nanangensis]|uniref:Uncharacterized protein n=1 Tax=Aspergillus nanangensis TaxID=2582783 RepID=A0AAD4CL53_ASPNN|nr:hypothetical protein FE257_009825 [Aspergillus nanangensis]